MRDRRDDADQYVVITEEDLEEDAFDRIRPHAKRLLLAAADPEVTDARLGRRLRSVLVVENAPSSPVREANVVNLMAWLEESVERDGGRWHP